jgi:hypothetical protein
VERGGLMVKVLGSRSKGRGFELRSCHRVCIIAFLGKVLIDSGVNEYLFGHV